jgi:hypothetical protein
MFKPYVKVRQQLILYMYKLIQKHWIANAVFRLVNLKEAMFRNVPIFFFRFSLLLISLILQCFIHRIHYSLLT